MQYRYRKKKRLEQIAATGEIYKLVPLTKCAKCGETDKDKLTRHHKIPKSKGGPDSPWNIQILCEDCHKKVHRKNKKKKRIKK